MSEMTIFTTVYQLLHACMYILYIHIYTHVITCMYLVHLIRLLACKTSAGRSPTRKLVRKCTEAQHHFDLSPDYCRVQTACTTGLYRVPVHGTPRCPVRYSLMVSPRANKDHQSAVSVVIYFTCKTLNQRTRNFRFLFQSSSISTSILPYDLFAIDFLIMKSSFRESNSAHMGYI